MKKKVIFYDLDGTLVDTREDIARAANHMIEAMGGKPLARPEIEKFVGRGLMHLIRGCLKTDENKALEKGSRLYREHYQAHMLDHTRLYPAAAEVLEHFKDRTQAVITNKPDPFSREMLKALKVDGYFDWIIAGGGPYPKKPDPSSVLSILEQKQVPASDALFVGDSEIDIETGRNAGVKTVVISHGFATPKALELAEPDFMVPDFKVFLAKARQEAW